MLHFDLGFSNSGLTTEPRVTLIGLLPLTRIYDQTFCLHPSDRIKAAVGQLSKIFRGPPRDSTTSGAWLEYILPLRVTLSYSFQQVVPACYKKSNKVSITLSIVLRATNKGRHPGEDLTEYLAISGSSTPDRLSVCYITSLHCVMDQKNINI